MPTTIEIPLIKEFSFDPLKILARLACGGPRPPAEPRIMDLIDEEIQRASELISALSLAAEIDAGEMPDLPIFKGAKTVSLHLYHRRRCRKNSGAPHGRRSRSQGFRSGQPGFGCGVVALPPMLRLPVPARAGCRIQSVRILRAGLSRMGPCGSSLHLQRPSGRRHRCPSHGVFYDDTEEIGFFRDQSLCRSPFPAPARLTLADRFGCLPDQESSNSSR